MAMLLVFFAAVVGRMDTWLGWDGKGIMDAFKPADHYLGVQTIATEHARRILDGLTAQNAATAPAQGLGTAGRGNTQPATKTAHTAQEDGADGSAAQG